MIVINIYHVGLVLELYYAMPNIFTQHQTGHSPKAYVTLNIVRDDKMPPHYFKKQ